MIRIVDQARCARVLLCVVFGLSAVLPGPGYCQGWFDTFVAEQRGLCIRSPSQLPRAPLPNTPDPPTVRQPQADRPEWYLSLDEAIAIALEHSQVVRVLAGSVAASSGRTQFDPAVSNTAIDQARARFDPNLSVQNSFTRREPPQAFFDPAAPAGVRIEGEQLDQYLLGVDVSKTTPTGGTLSLGVQANPLHSSAVGLPLNPETRSSVDLSFTQPLLQGGGIAANRAPIEVARIDTERSFYQVKESVQELVRSVIEAYWRLVAARTDVWARRQQVQQGEESYNLAVANFQVQRANAGDVAQARTALATFRANLVASEANLLGAEAAIRNLLGFPPADGRQIVPVTPPPMEWIGTDWETVLRTAEQYRPDLIDLKLLLESDEQQLLLAGNAAMPRVDAVAGYHWDALGGQTPDGTTVSSGAGRFTGWQFGVNVSMPLGLRQSRAEMRRRELLLMRDRAQLQQALHNAVHLLADNYRRLAASYEQYQAFKDARIAAKFDLGRRMADQRLGGIQGTRFLEVRIAIADWGNAVSAEAQALTQYNIELANLQQQMGTLLEEHEIRFVEQRYGSIGPLGRLARPRAYPQRIVPSENEPQYPVGDQPAENVFDLEEPSIEMPPLPLQQPSPTSPQSQAVPPSGAIRRGLIQPSPGMEPARGMFRP